jgi:hypothetical protein
MKGPLVIVLGALVLVTVSTLAVMNKTCKSSQHAWCAPMRHHIKFGRTRHPDALNQSYAFEGKRVRRGHVAS